MSEEYGVLSTGFARKRLDQIYSELCKYFKGTIGIDPSEHPQSFFAVIVQSFADKIEELWELTESVYYQMYPGSADGVNLDNVIQLAGFSRKEKKRSRYTLACTGVDGTTIPYGSIVKSTTAPEQMLQSSLNQKISRENFWQIKVRPVLTDVSTSSEYVITVHTNVDSGSVGTVVEEYSKTITGCATYADAYAAMKSAFDECGQKVGLSVTELDTLDTDDAGKVVKTIVLTGKKSDDSFFAEFSSNVQVCEVTSNLSFETVEYGDIALPLGTITSIVSGVDGFTSVTNAVKYTPGRLAESDSSIRLRYAESIAIRSGNTIDRICAALISDVDGCDYAKGYENYTDETDSDGRPPHSLEIVVHGGSDTEVAETIWNGKAAGIRPYGSHYAYINDSEGIRQYVQFTRIEAVTLHLIISLEVDSDKLDNNYREKIESVLLAVNLSSGQDIRLQEELIPVILKNVNGINYVDMTGRLETSGSEQTSFRHGTIKVGFRQQPVITADSIEVKISE